MLRCVPNGEVEAPNASGTVSRSEQSFTKIKFLAASRCDSNQLICRKFSRHQ